MSEARKIISKARWAIVQDIHNGESNTIEETLTLTLREKGVGYMRRIWFQKRERGKKKGMAQKKLSLTSEMAFDFAIANAY